MGWFTSSEKQSGLCWEEITDRKQKQVFCCLMSDKPICSCFLNDYYHIMQPVVGVWESNVSHRRQTPAERAEAMLIISADEEKGETLQLLMEILQSRVCMRIQANKVDWITETKASCQLRARNQQVQQNDTMQNLIFFNVVLYIKRRTFSPVNGKQVIPNANVCARLSHNWLMAAGSCYWRNWHPSSQALAGGEVSIFLRKRHPSRSNFNIERPSLENAMFISR